jgi:hypothetical protein
MQRSTHRAIATLAVVLGTLWLAAPAQASGAHPATTGAPSLTSPSSVVLRGRAISLLGSNLQPSAAYTLSADYGEFSQGSKTETESTDSSGAFRTQYYLPSDVAASSVTLALTDAGTGDPVTSLTVPVSAPIGYLIGPVCPRAPVWLRGAGLLDGSYQVSSTSGVFDVTSVTASDGYLQPFPELWLTTIPAQGFTITLTRSDTGEVVVSELEKQSASQVQSWSWTPWTRTIEASCFSSGEQVHVQPAAGITAPATVIAPGNGSVRVSFGMHLASQPSLPTSYGQLSGSESGQTANAVDRDNSGVPGTTLLAGQNLTSRNHAPLSSDMLASPASGYTFQMNNGNAAVMAWAADGSSHPIWRLDHLYLPEDGSSLKLLTNGNLVLYRPSGQVRWQTGTAGTGSANRLVMQQNGNLVLSTNTGALVWSKDTGQVRDAQGLLSYAYLASSRYRSAVYINGLVHQKSSSGQLIGSAGRTVYLQRYLNGHWQNVLARTSNSNGQLSVGFIQSAVYQYRLLVLPTANTAGTASGSTLR